MNSVGLYLLRSWAKPCSYRPHSKQYFITSSLWRVMVSKWPRMFMLRLRENALSPSPLSARADRRSPKNPPGRGSGWGCSRGRRGCFPSRGWYRAAAARRQSGQPWRDPFRRRRGSCSRSGSARRRESNLDNCRSDLVKYTSALHGMSTKQRVAMFNQIPFMVGWLKELGNVAESVCQFLNAVKEQNKIPSNDKS